MFQGFKAQFVHSFYGVMGRVWPGVVVTTKLCSKPGLVIIFPADGEILDFFALGVPVSFTPFSRALIQACLKW